MQTIPAASKVQQIQRMQAKLASQPSATVAAYATGQQSATRTFYTTRPAAATGAPPQQQDQLAKSYIQRNDIDLWRNSLSNDRIAKYKIERTAIESENMDSKITVSDTSTNNPKPLFITPPLSNIASNISGLGAPPKRTGDKPTTPFDHSFWMVLTRNVDPEMLQKNPELKYDIRMFFLRLTICLMRDLINMYENGEIMKETKRKAVIIKAKKLAQDFRRAAAQGKKVNLNVQLSDPDVRKLAYMEWIDGARVFFNKQATTETEQQDQTMSEANEGEQEQNEEEQGEGETGATGKEEVTTQNAPVAADVNSIDYIDPAKKAIEDQLIEHWAGLLCLDKEYITSKFENATSLILVSKVWIIPKGHTSAKLKAAYQLAEAEHLAKHGGIKDEEKMQLMKEAGYIYQAVDVLDATGKVSLRKALAIQKEREIQGLIKRMRDSKELTPEGEVNFYRHLAEEKEKIEDPFKVWSPRGSVVVPRIYRQPYANKGNDAPYGIRLMIDKSVKQLKKGKDSSFRPMMTSDEYEGVEGVEAYLNDFAGYGEGSEYSGMDYSNEEIASDNIGPNEGGQQQNEHHHPHHHHPEHHATEPLVTTVVSNDDNNHQPPQRNPHEVGTDDLRKDLAANLSEQQHEEQPKNSKRKSSANEAVQAAISGTTVSKKKKFS